jgi:hypothetical protein
VRHEKNVEEKKGTRTSTRIHPGESIGWWSYGAPGALSRGVRHPRDHRLTMVDAAELPAHDVGMNSRTPPHFVVVVALLTVGAWSSFVPAAKAQDGPVVTPKDGSGGDDDDDDIDDSIPPVEQDEALKVFAGTWRCTGVSSTQFGAESPSTFTWSVKKDLGNRWWTARGELIAKAKGAKPVVLSELWGFSRSAKGLVRSGATSLGGFVSSTSTGWMGDRFSWSGASSEGGRVAKEKLSWTKKSEREFTLEWSQGLDELHVVFEGSCKK